MVFCVNDGAVMDAWATDQKVEDTFVNFFADPYGDLTRLLGMELTHGDVYAKGLVHRSKRFAMYLEDALVRYLAVSASDTDPAGDDNPTESCAPALVNAIKSLPDITEL